jgi:phosphoesterase RecJ-like protein
MLKDIMTEAQCSQLRTLLDGAQLVVLCCHQNPDGDALGSMLGMGEVLRQMGKEAVMLAPDQYPDYLQWLPNSEKIVRYDKRKDFVEAMLKVCDLVICLDFNTLSRTDEMAAALEACKAPKVLIDHHLGPDVDTVLCVSHPEASSTS